jgi:Questin oxidase-like
VYYTTTAQRPPKAVRFDFFYMHGITSSIFYPMLFSQPWLSTRSKIRLLEWKGRVDLALYVARGSPELLLNEVVDYPISKDWNAVFRASISNEKDDGHVAKMVRAVAYGEIINKQYEAGGREKGFMITGDMWLKVANMSKPLPSPYTLLKSPAL